MSSNLKLTTLIVFLVIQQLTIAQTIISGGAISGSWSAANSPYLIENAIYIPNNDSLIIEPGVTIEFQAHNKILVRGKVIAKGNVNNPILFTSKDKEEGWLGIEFNDEAPESDTSLFEFCQFEYARASGEIRNERNGGAFFIQWTKKLKISNCTFSNCSATGEGGAIFCNMSNVHIYNNKFYNNVANSSTGALYLDEGDYLVKNNWFENNLSKGGYYGGALSSFHNNNCEITGNVFYNNTSLGTDYNAGAIYARYSTNIYNNLFIKNNTPNGRSGALFIRDENEVINNVFLDNSGKYAGAIYAHNHEGVITNNTIYRNIGEIAGAIYNYFYTETAFTNNIIWNNPSINGTTQIFIKDQGSEPNFYNNNIQGGESGIKTEPNVFFFGEYKNNINSTPLFANPDTLIPINMDSVAQMFSLLKESPCINKGDNSMTNMQFDFSHNPRVVGDTIDIGALEFQGLTEIQNLKNIPNATLLYPNPTSGLITIYHPTQKVSLISVYDLNSREVNYTKVGQNQIDISDHPKGIYFLKFETKSRTEVHKVVKH